MIARIVEIALLVLAALEPSAATGLQSTKVPHIGFLLAEAPDLLLDAFRDGLRGVLAAAVWAQQLGEGRANTKSAY